MTIDKSGARVRAMFDGIAARYDLLNHLLSGNQDKRWRRRAVRQLAPRRNECVLDLCCGTGDLTFEILRRQPHCRVVGADFSEQMLKLAVHKSAANQAAAADPNLAPAFCAGDALRLPFAAGSFDAAAVGFGVRNFEDTLAGMREMRRVMKPGARLMVLEFMRPTAPLLRFGFGLFFKDVLPLVGRAISHHGSAYSYLPASVGDFFSRAQFEALLRRAGFSNVRSVNFSGGIASGFLAEAGHLTNP